MTPILQTQDAEALSALRAVGVLISDSHDDKGGLAYLFPGHGTHSPSMFETHLAHSTAAANLIAMADEISQERSGFRLTDAVRGQADLPLDHPCVTQPAIYTAALAGAAMADENGLRPTMLIGHSLGEYAALAQSGAVSAETGLRMVIDRAELVASIPSERRGCMTAVLLDDDTQISLVRRAVARRTARGPIALGVINGPRQVVISGAAEIVGACASELEQLGLRTTQLAIGVGFHSPCLDEVVLPFEERLGTYSWTSPRIPMVSSIFGGLVDSEAIAGLPEILASQLITPFDFRVSLEVARASGVSAFVDCGPRAVLHKVVSSQVPADENSLIHLDHGPAHPERAAQSLRALAWIRHEEVPAAAENTNPEAAADSPVSGTDTTPATSPDVTRILQEAFADRTGYPIELIEPDLDLEADLGIDSVKRVEVVGHVGDTLGIDVTTLDFSESLNLNDLVAALSTALPTDTTPATSPDVTRILQEAFADRTGYPIELIEPDLDLEADLGIDSVKRVEVVGHVGDTLGIDVTTLDFSESLSLNDLVAALSTALPTDTTPATVGGDTAPEAVPDRRGTRRVLTDSERTTHRYIPQSVPLTDHSQPRTVVPGRAILVTASDTRLNDAVASILEDLGLSTTVVPGDDHAAARAEIEALSDLDEVATVVDLSCLRQHTDVVTPGDAWWNDVAGQYSTIFSVAQSTYSTLRSHGSQAAWVSVTASGGMSGTDMRRSGDPLAGIVAGFVKSLALELRDMHTRVIDFDVLDAEAVSRAVRTELTCHRDLDDVEIGYIDGQAHVVRVLPTPVTTSQYAIPRPLRAGSCVVMSGGSRGIVRECALALAKAHDVDVVLLGRSDPDDAISAPWLSRSDEQWAGDRSAVMREARRRHPGASVAELSKEYDRIHNTRRLVSNLADIAERTERVHYLVCDVTDPVQVDAALARVRREFGPVSGIVHGAGLESFGMVPRKTLEETTSAIAVKARGFHNLLSATADDDLSIFISFGSISGRFGMDGQVDYTAGAALLAQLSHLMSHSRDLNPSGTPFVTMEWTAWSEVGMAANPAVIAVQAEARGMEYMSVEEGTRHFLDEIELGTANPEVLYSGRLGSNRPSGQMSLVAADGYHLAHSIDEDGTVLARSELPLIDSIERDGDRLVATRTLWPGRDRYLPDHLVKGTATFPGVLHFEAQMETALVLAGPDATGIELDTLNLQTFLKCRADDKVTIHVDARTAEDGTIETELTSVFRTPSGMVLDERRPQSNARFRVLHTPPAARKSTLDVEHLFDNTVGEFNIERYHELTEHTISFGPTFRYLSRAAQVDDNTVVGELTVPGIPGLFSDVPDPRFLCNPILVDNVGRLALMRQLHRNGQMVVPTRMRGARLYRQPQVRERCYGRIIVLEDYDDGLEILLEIVDESGMLLCSGDHIRLTAIGSLPRATDLLLPSSTPSTSRM